jgi:hypothetical protein
MDMEITVFEIYSSLGMSFVIISSTDNFRSRYCMYVSVGDEN